MIYLTLCAMALPAWQDYQKKKVYHSTLMGLWAMAMVGLAAEYVNGADLEWTNIAKVAIAAIISFLSLKYGKDRYVGRGDILMLAWLYVMLPFAFYLKVLTIGFCLLWIWAVACKIAGKTEELPMLPFLWFGYVLSLLL